MVAAGMGVSLVPEMALDKKSSCAYIPLADDHATRTIGAVRLRGRSFFRLHNAFLSQLLNQ
jgi:LysR family hydrogen peroxide-inducible transcriptional activator